MTVYQSLASAMAMILGVGAVSSSALADPARDRDFCSDRPGIGTPACTIAPGRIAVELGIADWTLDSTAEQRTDTTLVGDTEIRVGLTNRMEGLVGWTALGFERARDRISGKRDNASKVGDLTLGFKANLNQPDGSGFSMAVQPFVTVPIGRPPIGAGDWGAGVIVPISYDLTSSINLQFSPQLEAAVDEDGSGRHLNYSSVVGAEIEVSDDVSVSLELALARDADPQGHSTQALGAVSAGWMLADNTQLDIGTTIGLNRSAPDAQIYFGLSRLF